MVGAAHVRRRCGGCGVAFDTARREQTVRNGLLSVRCETSPDIGLVTYTGGGCLHHTSASNLADHVFLMDGVKVAEVFPPLIDPGFQMLEDDWPTTVKAFDGSRLRHRRRLALVPAPSQRGGRP